MGGIKTQLQSSRRQREKSQSTAGGSRAEALLLPFFSPSFLTAGRVSNRRALAGAPPRVTGGGGGRGGACAPAPSVARALPPALGGEKGGAGGRIGLHFWGGFPPLCVFPCFVKREPKCKGSLFFRPC